MSELKSKAKAKYIPKNLGGRPTKWSKSLEDKAVNYIAEHSVKYGQSLPTIAGLASVLDVHRDTLHVWVRESRGTFPDIVERLMATQEVILINKGLMGEFQPTITKLMLTKHGYSDRNEISSPNGRVIELTMSERAIRVKQLLDQAQERMTKEEKEK
jgi:hypothetical protein